MTGIEILKKQIEMEGKEFLFYCGDDIDNKDIKYQLKLCKIVGGGHYLGNEWLWKVQFKDGYTTTVSSYNLYNYKVK